jgi:shikimate kinase/3-dehydroquinate synthase
VKPALVFIGFMGAGKSAAARDAAEALGGVQPVDADVLIETDAGRSVAEIFVADGEPAFREREARVVGGWLERADGGIIALGGGALGSDRVRAALRRHTAVLLDISAQTAWKRTAGRARGKRDRPLARDRAALTALHAARQGTYLDAADAVIPEGTRGAVVRALGCLAALPDAPEGTRLLWARAASGEYPVWVGRGLLGRVPLRPPGGGGVGDGSGGRAFCVSDATVAGLYAGAVGELAGLVEILPGEEHKTLATAERVWRALAEQGVTRADHVVALGGGVVGDLGGFCAATYQRGVPVVQVPTSVVAQVDSAYGGKTGVDLPEAKNYVGAYHQPLAVIADTATLATLPPEEHAAGFAEVLKTALIAGGELWERLRAGGGVDDDVILGCARTKLAVVADDERDSGRRQVLNLGHTVGHALETVTGYGRLRHGEAVALGLLAALRLSGQDALREEVRQLLEANALPVTIDRVNPGEVLAATARDKKRTGRRVPFVLVHAPGDVRPGEEVQDGELLAAVTELTR